MIQIFLEKKYPEYKNLSNEEKIKFFNSVKKEDYEEFRNYIGNKLFEKEDFENWEYEHFNEFFLHPNFNEFSVISKEWVGEGESHFFLSDSKFTEFETLYDQDINEFNFQKEYCPHLINYHPYYFENLYGFVIELNGKKLSIDGSILSFQKIMIDLCIEFTSKYKSKVKAPAWLKNEKEIKYFYSINFNEFRDSELYQIINDANIKISKYMENNSFILLDKKGDSFIPDNTVWDWIISSEKDLKNIKIKTFFEDVKNKYVEEIPDEFLVFFAETINSFLVKIMHSLNSRALEAEKNQIHTLSKIKKHKPMEIVFSSFALDDMKKIQELDEKIEEQKEINKLNKNILSIGNKYKLGIFRDIIVDNNDKISLFKINLVKELMRINPEMFH